MLYYDGKYLCFTLEDAKRDTKVKGQTRIPAGRYKVGLRNAGSMHPSYMAKFPGLHRGMLHVLNVPGFEYIYIHIGNTIGDTEGCLLTGYGVAVNRGVFELQQSTPAYEDLYEKVVEDAIAGTLDILYVDEPA